MNSSKKKPAFRFKKARGIRQALENFFERRGAGDKFRLMKLWESWEMVMGAELSRIVFPLGAKDGVLLIGAEDSMMLNELGYFTGEILERANAFACAFVGEASSVNRAEPESTEKKAYFSKVRLELLQGRIPLYPPRYLPKLEQVEEEWARPQGLCGRLLERMAPESPIGRAYRSYLQSFEGKH